MAEFLAADLRIWDSTLTRDDIHAGDDMLRSRGYGEDG